jgi:hypothetical protein
MCLCHAGLPGIQNLWRDRYPTEHAAGAQRRDRFAIFALYNFLPTNRYPSDRFQGQSADDEPPVAEQKT